MGGLVIPIGLLIGYPLACALSGTAESEIAWTVIATVVGGCIVRVVDDWLKVRRGRNLGGAAALGIFYASSASPHFQGQPGVDSNDRARHAAAAMPAARPGTAATSAGSRRRMKGA
jgi:UDP-N-acetylmuramyl pentapeptide phosphotransferase/UDP-N-acetylglucosamine-1-phosphate transferase